MKTHIAKLNELKRNWHLVDAKDKILGRLASGAAQLLIGKGKTDYTANMDCGDWVVVINADKIRVTGKKGINKKYHWHTGFPKGLRELSFNQLMAKDPKKVIAKAVWGMLPKNKLRAKRIIRLKVFTGEEHNYKDKFKNVVKN